jgi:predicted Zn-dependent peptidase
LGFRTFPSGHKDEATLKLLSIILGGSMSSRLFIELRERRGLAYFVRANTEFYTDSGYISVYAGVNQDKLEEAIKIILVEFKKMKETLVTPAELKKAKDLIAGRLIVSMEQSDDYSSWYGQQFVFKKEFISPEERLKKLKKVSATDIKKLAKKLFVNDSLNLSIIGEVKDEKKIKNILQIK